MMRPGILTAILCLSACAVGPNYRRPAVATPASWSEAGARGTDAGIGPIADAWWESFHDAELASLVRRAVAGNQNLAQATARVAQARASRGVARADFFPQIGAEVQVAKERQIAVGLTGAPGQVQGRRFAYDRDLYLGELTLSWEVDLFGRIRRSVEAASGDLRASVEDRRSVLVSLLGDVGRAYATLRGDQLRLRIARENIATATDTLALTRVQATAGVATERDVAQAQAQLQSISAQVPPIETSIETSLHRLSVLIGEAPGVLKTELSTQVPIPPVPPVVPLGVPSELLRRRPDIGRAEAQLAAATARVGIAEAERFPHFTLLGDAGRAATRIQDVRLGVNSFFLAGPQVTLPLFTGGRIRANIQNQRARVDEAVANYRGTILTAFQECEDALIAYGKEQDRRDRLAAAVQADEDAVHLARVQYSAGLADFLNVLESERQLYADRDLLALSQAQVTVNLVTLYRSLGGGWQVEPLAGRAADRTKVASR